MKLPLGEAMTTTFRAGTFSTENGVIMSEKEGKKFLRFGKFLQKLMVDRGVRSKELAELLGVTASTISEWRGGTNPPTDNNIKALSQFFGVTEERIRTELRPPKIEQLAELAAARGRPEMQVLIEKLKVNKVAYLPPEELAVNTVDDEQLDYIIKDMRKLLERVSK
jgi:transcriptional regulator with XRE-family HTH domain